MIQQLSREQRWPAYGYHFLPHDVAVTEWGTNKTRVEQLIDLGVRPTRVPRHQVDDGINGGADELRGYRVRRAWLR